MDALDCSSDTDDAPPPITLSLATSRSVDVIGGLVEQRAVSNHLKSANSKRETPHATVSRADDSEPDAASHADASGPRLTGKWAHAERVLRDHFVPTDHEPTAADKWKSDNAYNSSPISHVRPRGSRTWHAAPAGTHIAYQMYIARPWHRRRRRDGRAGHAGGPSRSRTCPRSRARRAARRTFTPSASSSRRCPSSRSC